jgi:Domain of unknown function (DUF4440)
MEINRRQLLLPALVVGIVGVVPALAASPDEEQVAKAVEAFRLAQIEADGRTLDELCAAELSYSHADADARVEDKAAFIAHSTSGKSKFLSLEYRDPQIRIVGPAAIVRFRGISEWTSNGKTLNANLRILMNWQKQGNDWKLLSRAATDLSTPRPPSIANCFWRFFSAASTIQG